MKFIKVAHSLNKTYNVEDLAIEAAVKKSFKEVKELKLLEYSVEINSSANGFKVFAKVEKIPKAKYSEVINKVEESIDRYSLNLIGVKPDNIQLIFK